VIVSCELEDAWVEANEIALSLEDDALEIVVQRGARRTFERLERLDVAAEEAL